MEHLNHFYLGDELCMMEWSNHASSIIWPLFHPVFLEQNPGVSFFDIYHLFWEFSKDSLKFISITRAVTADGTGNAEVTPHSMRTKATTRWGKKEKIVEHIKESLKDTLHHDSSNNISSSLLLAAAFSQLAPLLLTGTQQSMSEHSLAMLILPWGGGMMIL